MKLTGYLSALVRTTRAWLSPPMATRVIACDPSSISFPRDATTPTVTSPETEAALRTAAHQLTTLHRCVAFPTETVYGLGACALVPTAAARIFTTKGRPADNPLIVHVSSFAMLHSLLPRSYTISHTYQLLMDAFWPGPLTLLFPADESKVPGIVTAGQKTVGVRMPAHPVARALIAVADAPLAAPSANASGRPSPTRAEHVLHDLDGKLGVILDGGPCGVGVESTVVDGLQPDGAVRVLRPGGVTVEDIEQVLKEGLGEGAEVPKVLVHKRDFRDEAMEQAPTTPGMKYRHYSPSVPVTLLMTSTPPPPKTTHSTISSLVSSLLEDLPSSAQRKIGLLTPVDSPLAQQLQHVEQPGITWKPYHLGRINEPWVTAQRLFDGLLTLDQQGVDMILIEEIGEEKEGLAVMNRVRKAASNSMFLSLP